MKITQDYICQVLIAHHSMLNKYCTKPINRVVLKTHSRMLHIAYDMIMRGEY